MTRRDTLACVHEPFGDAFYFGPERLSSRYEKDEKARIESGFADSTYKTIFERIEREGKEVRALYFAIPQFLFLMFFSIFGGHLRCCIICVSEETCVSFMESIFYLLFLFACCE